MHIWYHLISWKPSLLDIRYPLPVFAGVFPCRDTPTRNSSHPIPRVSKHSETFWKLQHFHLGASPSLSGRRCDRHSGLSQGKPWGSWLLRWLQWETGRNPFDQMRSFLNKTFMTCCPEDGECRRVCMCVRVCVYVCRGSAFSRACCLRSVQAVFDSLAVSWFLHMWQALQGKQVGYHSSRIKN